MLVLSPISPSPGRTTRGPHARAYNGLRARLHVRRRQTLETWGLGVANYYFGPHEVRPAQRMLLSGGIERQVGARAFDVLLALIERRDRLVSADELMSVVWPGLVVEENNLSVQIHFLRKLLGSGVLATVRGRGYRFVADLDESAKYTPALDDQRAGVRPVQPQVEQVLMVVARRREEFGVMRRPDQEGGLGRWAAKAEALHAKPIHASSDLVALAFNHPRSALQAAWQIVRHETEAHAAMLSSDLPSMELVDDIARVQSLAFWGKPGAVVTSVDMLENIVPGVDASLEDLGDVSLSTSDSVRAYQLHPTTMPELAPSTVLSDHAKPSIAVLPFECVVGNDPQDMFGEALADDVTSFLAKYREFSVISGLSSRRLKRCGWAIAGVGGCLNAGFLVTGTYQVFNGQLRLNAQLHDVKHGHVVCSIRHQALVSEAFDFEQPLGARVVNDIVKTFFSHALTQTASHPLAEIESYALLFSAMGLMHRLSTHDFDKAKLMLDMLSQRTGCMGIASAWLAKWHVLRVVQGWSHNPHEDSVAALACVQRALDHDSTYGLAFSIGGLVHAYLHKDMGAAGDMYQRALQANPSEPLAWLFTGTRAAYVGDGHTAEQAGERALKLSPIDPLRYFFDSLAATAVLANGKWERAAELSRQSIRANRTHASTWRTLAYAQVQMGDVDGARQSVGELLKIEPSYTVSAFKERFPGRDGPMAEPWAEALKIAGLPA